MGDDWDAEDFDVDKGFVDESKEEEEEDLALAEVNVPEPQPKPKPESEAAKPQKTKLERIEEKKAQRRAAEKAETKGSDEASKLLAAEEKRKREELQKASDLTLAMETFSAASSGPTLDSMEPKSPEEFAEFKDALADKITQFKTSTHYMTFAEQLIIKCCASMDVGDLRHMGAVLSNMAIEKQKAKSVKTTSKKKGKATLGSFAVGKGSKRLDDLDYDDNELGAEFDDFI